jgi:hypothetical protein
MNWGKGNAFCVWRAREADWREQADLRIENPSKNGVAMGKMTKMVEANSIQQPNKARRKMQGILLCMGFWVYFNPHYRVSLVALEFGCLNEPMNGWKRCIHSQLNIRRVERMKMTG